MGKPSIPWLGAAVIAGLMIFGGILWMSAPEVTDVPESAAKTQMTATGEARPAPLPFAGSGASDARPAADGGSIGFDATIASLTALVRSDPEAAARSIETIPPGDERVAAMRTVFREWAVIALHDALAWAGEMEREEDQDMAREFVYYRLAEDDPRQALELARQAGAKTEAPVVQDLVQQWAARDVQGAQAWALALPAGPGRDQVLSRVSYVLSQSDPAAAGQIVAEQIPAGPQQDEAAMTVLHQWAIRELDAAATWVAQFPEGPLRSRAEKELAGIREYQSQSGE